MKEASKGEKITHVYAVKDGAAAVKSRSERHGLTRRGKVRRGAEEAESVRNRKKMLLKNK